MKFGHSDRLLSARNRNEQADYEEGSARLTAGRTSNSIDLFGECRTFMIRKVDAKMA